MKTFKLNIDLDGDAFAEGNLDLEIARILRKVADEVLSAIYVGATQTIRDTNGNRVGGYKVSR